MTNAGLTSLEQQTWKPDILGEGFEALTLPLGPDPDGESDVYATLVRYTPTRAESPQTEFSKPAVLWVHGATDYFFQKETAYRLSEAGYAFYALDLRKCGRSRTEGQTWHYASDLSVYHQELTLSLDVICQNHERLVPIGHSTAGCTIPHWMDELRRTDSERHAHFAGLILDSPWLDVQGVPSTVAAAVKPLLRLASKINPMIPFPGGGLKTFGQSLHESEYGEHDYDLELKPLGGHPKYVGWVDAVFRNQELVHAGMINVGVPVLTLCSTKSLLGKEFSEESLRTDVILDVNHMKKWAPKLSNNVVIHPLQDAIHEVYLSKKPVRDEAFRITCDWLGTL